MALGVVIIILIYRKYLMYTLFVFSAGTFHLSQRTWKTWRDIFIYLGGDLHNVSDGWNCGHILSEGTKPISEEGSTGDDS